MQTFPDMRRDSTRKENLKTVTLLSFILLYASMSDMLYWLPPLFSVAFVLFCKLMDTGKLHYALPLFVYLLFFEAGKGYPFLSAITFFCLVYFFIMPRLQFLVRSPKYLIPFYTFFIYYGYSIFSVFLGYIMGISTPNISSLFLFFSIIEAAILVFLL